MCGRIMYRPNKQTYSVPCNGVKAKEVSVKLSTGNYLSLAEVQVFGKFRVYFYCMSFTLEKSILNFL